MKLRTKFAIAILLVMVVLSGVVLGSVELFKQRTIAQEQADLDETANLTAEQIATVVQVRKGEVATYASREQDNYGNTTAFLTEFVNDTRYFAAQAVAPNGTIVDFRGNIHEAQREQAIGTDVSNRTVVKQALEGDVYVSRPEQLGEPPNETYLVTVGAPVGDPQSPKGVLVGAVTIDVGDFFAATAPLETSSQAVAVSHTVDGERMVLHEPRRTFDRQLSASATVRDVEWTVTVIRDRTGLTQRLETLALVQGISLALVLGSVVGLGAWDYRANLSQTERLLDGFVALQEGRFDYEMSLAAAEEWTQISDGFNEMATGLKERERAIREREQRLGVLNRVLRHNLQNDMGVIINYAEMIREFSEPEQEEMAVEKIVSMGKGLIEHGKKARKIEDAMESAEEGSIPVDVVPLVEDAVAEFGEQYPDVTVRTHHPEQAYADAISTVDYAVDNVVENAFEHNDAADPYVDVVVTVGDSLVDVTVVDNGPGVPEYEQNVFGDKEETDLDHGSGIGLWLAYWVVEKSEGRLAFGDSHDGGAAVTITLPRADEPVEEESAAQAEDEGRAATE